MKKIVSTWILFSSMLALTFSFVAFAQAADESGSAPVDGKDRPALRGERALGPFTLFDANHDGAISADEMTNAAAALRKLDKNGDGKLTANELHPGRPPRERGGDAERGNGDMPPPPPEL
ncbi:MAG: hypothetical protein K0R17_3034 [Rariglobus sp.]|jgi:hypothetical protein|nr:hypothetical protein [Rariglobus sp.]